MASLKLKTLRQARAAKLLDENKRFKKGNPGRIAGIPNKCSRPFVSVKQSILEAFNDPRIGGTEGLIQWVTKHPRRREVFYGWIMRLLPKTIEMPSDTANTALEELLNKYKELNAEDLRAKAQQLADEVSRACGTPTHNK